MAGPGRMTVGGETLDFQTTSGRRVQMIAKGFFQRPELKAHCTDVFYALAAIKDACAATAADMNRADSAVLRTVGGRQADAQHGERRRYIEGLAAIYETATGEPGKPKDVGGGRRGNSPGAFMLFVQQAWLLAGLTKNQAPKLRAVQSALRPTKVRH